MNSNRLHSLDAMRGFIMVLPALEITLLYEHMHEVFKGKIREIFIKQFFHHPWNGAFVIPFIRKIYILNYNKSLQS